MNYCEKYFSELEKIAVIPELAELEGKKLLVTGASGLILSPLVDALCYANEKNILHVDIYAAARTEEEISSRFTAYYGKPWLHYVYYDAVQPVSFDFKADYIIHGASNAHPAAYLSEPVETLLANVVGVNELLKYAHTAGTKRVLYISSSEVYGKKEAHRPYNEDDYGFIDILNTRACYPSGKRAAETLCVSYYQQHDIETVIVRPGHIYGPTATPMDSRATAQFVRDVLAGKDILMKSAGSQLRSYCYCMDCATAILFVLLKGKPTEAYNISNRDSIVSIRQIAEEIARASGRKVVFEEASEAEKKGYNMMDNSSLTSDKLEGLGWKAMYSLEDGVKSTIDIMKG
jgi:nucleoside-diphosphate-sugar epimerase